MTTPRWTVHLEMAKPPVVRVNGIDVSKIFTSVRVDWSGTGFPQLTLGIPAADVAIEGEGVVVQEPPGGGQAEIVALIRSLDAAELDYRSLHPAYDHIVSTGERLKLALVDLLEGREPRFDG